MLAGSPLDNDGTGEQDAHREENRSSNNLANIPNTFVKWAYLARSFYVPLKSNLCLGPRGGLTPALLVPPVHHPLPAFMTLSPLHLNGSGVSG